MREFAIETAPLVECQLQQILTLFPTFLEICCTALAAITRSNEVVVRSIFDDKSADSTSMCPGQSRLGGRIGRAVPTASNHQHETSALV